MLAKQVLSQLSYTPPRNCMILIASLIQYRANDYLPYWQVLSQTDLPTHHKQPVSDKIITPISRTAAKLIFGPFGPRTHFL